ncbi:SDR family NAD(P)-dependent oxidoreductase [Rhabdothermincola salaria]|uniref:SDR family NAD(P)-dependent oxidoreductase n=1 Tax=Rhabdothermincola salaria TaxID=2903142 RepID=UPI001E5AF513|nr:SDR family NAD(P)-dependent oxidoreductase [Rhabdothermincola salaria]
MELAGRVAVVTGGANGIGAALSRAFLGEGMKVVVADVVPERVDTAVAEMSALGEVSGVVTDVSDPVSVEALADRTYDTYGACHLLCNNAGVGAPKANVWETTVNDWRWVHGVNVMGVVHGILAFVPRMIAAGEEGHVLNTSSGDGGIEPLPGASVYASSKAAVTTLTECLAQQLVSEGTNLRASIFYPSGGLLRTGLWESDRTRPAELAREKPRPTEAMTVAKLEAMAEQKGFELSWQDLDELARIVVAGITAGDYIHMIDRQSMGPTLHGRADALASGRLPTHHAGPLG